MEGRDKTLGSPWPPLAIRPCSFASRSPLVRIASSYNCLTERDAVGVNVVVVVLVVVAAVVVVVIFVSCFFLVVVVVVVGWLIGCLPYILI
jgi:hypothetical protein